MTKADGIQERLLQFGDRIITLCDTLFLTTAGEQIAAQLLRSGITPALNLIEARLAETHAESINKYRIAVAALDESEFWLRSINPGDMLSPDTLAPLITECQQLRRILIASIRYGGNPAKRPLAAIDYPTTQLPN